MLVRCLQIFLLFLSTFALAETDQFHADGPYSIIKYQTPDGAVLAGADVNWENYTKVQLKMGTVEFRENWTSDQQQLNSYTIKESDKERVKTDMADLLEAVLKRSLSKRETYTLTDANGVDVLRFTPSITKLDIYAPLLALTSISHTRRCCHWQHAGSERFPAGQLT